MRAPTRARGRRDMWAGSVPAPGSWRPGVWAGRVGMGVGAWAWVWARGHGCGRAGMGVGARAEFVDPRLLIGVPYGNDRNAPCLS